MQCTHRIQSALFQLVHMITVAKKGLIVLIKIVVFLWRFWLFMNENFLILRKRRKAIKTKVYSKYMKKKCVEHADRLSPS